MINFAKTKTIIRRELKEKLFSKTFIIMTLLIPGIIMLSIGVQVYFRSYEDDALKQFFIIAENENIINEIREKFDEKNFEEEKNFKFEYKTLSEKSFEKELEKLKPLLIDETLTGIVFIPENVLEQKKVFYYSKTPAAKSVKLELSQTINNALVSLYFKNKGLTKEDISFVKKSVRINEMKVSKEAITEKSRGGEILAFIFIFLLYMSLLSSGQIILRSVIEEKQNRIVEVLLSSVNSNELMAGKIIGAAITSFVQMVIWLSPVFIAISTSWITLPKGLAVSLPIWQWIYFLFNFIIGLLTFLGLFAAMGSLFDNEQDAQSGIWPLMILILIPFFIAISLADNPGNSLAKIFSLVPFASLFIMPERMGLGDVPTLEFIFSLLINLATLIIIVPITGKIYRTAILMTGKKPEWKEIIKWLKT